MRKIKRSFSAVRSLPIDRNIQEQLEILEKLVFSKELANILTKKTDDIQVYLIYAVSLQKHVDY